MSKAVRYNDFGDVEVLRVVEVERPVPGPGEVLVEVVAASINPGEGNIRRGVLRDRWPSTFPSGQGSDLAGRVLELGPGVVEFTVGDEVIGFVDSRGSQAELVAVPVSQLTAKPAGVSWEVGAALYVAGTTAFAAVRAVDLSPGDTLVVAGAAGGVGVLVVQLAKSLGATVIGIVGSDNVDYLTSLGALPVLYGDGVEERVREAAAGRIDAFIDTFGAGYVEMALSLGIPPRRIDTIANFAAIAKYGVKGDGNGAAATIDVVAELAGLVADGRLSVPIAAVYPLAEVRAAYRELEKHHTRGKIVLRIASGD